MLVIYRFLYMFIYINNIICIVSSFKIAAYCFVESFIRLPLLYFLIKRCCYEYPLPFTDQCRRWGIRGINIDEHAYNYYFALNINNQRWGFQTNAVNYAKFIVHLLKTIVKKRHRYIRVPLNFFKKTFFFIKGRIS